MSLRTLSIGVIALLTTFPLAAQTAQMFDFSSQFNVDVVVNNGAGNDTAQDPLDATDHAFITQSVANAQFPSDPDGLPDNAFFAANGIRPAIQLDWSNSDNGNNAYQFLNDGETLTIDIPDASYEAIHLFTMSAEDDGQLTVTVTYTDNSTTTRTLYVPDWYWEPVDGYTLIDGLDRMQIDMTGYEDDNNPAIFGIPMEVNPKKQVASIEVEAEFDGPEMVALFGIAGIAPTPPVPFTSPWGLAAIALILATAAMIRLRS